MSEPDTRWDVVPLPWTTSRRAAFIRVWTRGDSARSIAVAFGLTVRGVYSRRRDFNLPPRVVAPPRFPRESRR